MDGSAIKWHTAVVVVIVVETDISGYLLIMAGYTMCPVLDAMPAMCIVCDVAIVIVMCTSAFLQKNKKEERRKKQKNRYIRRAYNR